MPALQRRPVAIGAMPRHAAVVVDMAERATPLAQNSSTPPASGCVSGMSKTRRIAAGNQAA